MTDDEVKAIIDKTCKKFYPNLYADSNRDTDIEKLIKAERLYTSCDTLLAYSKYINFHGLVDQDEFLENLRESRLENGSTILELRQKLGLDTSMFDNEELGLND